MGFFETLRRVLSAPASDPDAAETTGPLVIEPGGLTDESGVDSGPAVPPDPVSPYDRSQWRRKLKRILDELPASRHEWDGLIYEARALELDPGWVAECQRQEFLLMVRRVVADRIVTEPEHRKLELARELIGMPESEAEGSLLTIVAEAESFFGKPVRDA